VLQEHLGEGAVLERDDPVGPGIASEPSVMQAIPFEWWLRPVSMQERDGEHSAVVCMLT